MKTLGRTQSNENSVLGGSGRWVVTYKAVPPLGDTPYRNLSVSSSNDTYETLPNDTSGALGHSKRPWVIHRMETPPWKLRCCVGSRA